jgi:outer membrane protein OmpA-like peptidoglycan-associated protein
MASLEVKKALKVESAKRRLDAKRSVELWIYSFADMYLILVFFFIAIAASYSARKPVPVAEKKVAQVERIPTAGRGPSSAVSVLSIEFKKASSELSAQGIENLKLLLPIVKSNSKAILDIEGYSDRAQLKKGSGYSSNLSLSSSRAVKVAEWFMLNGVHPSRVRTYSFGNGQTWANTKDGTITDRRVVVKLYPKGGA